MQSTVWKPPRALFFLAVDIHKRRKIWDGESIHAAESSLRFPGRSGVWSSPFFIGRFEVGVSRHCHGELCVWVLGHHFQLGFNGFDLCTNTVEEIRNAHYKVQPSLRLFLINTDGGPDQKSHTRNPAHPRELFIVFSWSAVLSHHMTYNFRKQKAFQKQLSIRHWRGREKREKEISVPILKRSHHTLSTSSPWTPVSYVIALDLQVDTARFKSLLSHKAHCLWA